MQANFWTTFEQHLSSCWEFTVQMYVWKSASVYPALELGLQECAAIAPHTTVVCWMWIWFKKNVTCCIRVKQSIFKPILGFFFKVESKVKMLAFVPMVWCMRYPSLAASSHWLPRGLVFKHFDAVIPVHRQCACAAKCTFYRGLWTGS